MMATHSKTWRVSLRVLVAALIGTVFAVIAAPSAGATTVGQGGTGSAWVAAYNRIGGSSAIGVAENGVHWWNNGCLQDYGGGRFSDAALMSPTCNQANVFPVVGRHWVYVARVGSHLVGYPYNDSHRWGAGWTQDFNYGGWGWTLVMYGDGVGESYGVHGGIRDYFISQGGATGWLGYPRSDEYAWNGVTRQDFQGGSIIWRANLGAKPFIPLAERNLYYSSGYGPATYVVLSGRSYTVASTAQLDSCYGGRGNVRQVSVEMAQAYAAVYPANGSAPGCTSVREQRAINWARSMLGNTGYNGWCERFVENAFGTTGRYASAKANLNQKLATGQLHAGDTNVPAGALAFFKPSWQNGNYGHTMLSLGGGQFISSGRTVHSTGLNTAAFGPYAGWAWADAAWAGRSA